MITIHFENNKFHCLIYLLQKVVVIKHMIQSFSEIVFPEIMAPYISKNGHKCS